jgi:hypothetical protein
MLNHFYGRLLAKVRECHLSADLEALGTYLRNRDHRSSALSGYMCGAAHLAACIDRGLVSLDGLTADGLQRFAREAAQVSRPTRASSQETTGAGILIAHVVERGKWEDRQPSRFTSSC